MTVTTSVTLNLNKHCFVLLGVMNSMPERIDELQTSFRKSTPTGTAILLLNEILAERDGAYSTAARDLTYNAALMRSTLAELIKLGLVIGEKDRYRLTFDGVYAASEIARQLTRLSVARISGVWEKKRSSPRPVRDTGGDVAHPDTRRGGKHPTRMERMEAMRGR